MASRLDRLSCVALSLVAFAGCVGGQSGTETGGKFEDPFNPAGIKVSPNACACAVSDTAAVALRGRVVEVDGRRVRVRVRALLGEGAIEPVLRFAIGDEVGGEVSEGCELQGLQPGDDVAVLHTPSARTELDCPELLGCMSRRCEGLLADDPRSEACAPECQRETRAQCATHAGDALLNGRLVIARWGGELSFPLGGQRAEGPLRVPAGDLIDLLDRNQCERLVMSALPDGGALAEPVPPGTDEGVADPEVGSAAK